MDPMTFVIGFLLLVALCIGITFAPIDPDGKRALYAILVIGAIVALIFWLR